MRCPSNSPASVNLCSPKIPLRAGTLAQNIQIYGAPRFTQAELETLLSHASRAADGPVHTVEYDPLIKSKLEHSINFRAKCGANLATKASDIRGNETLELHRVGGGKRACLEADLVLSVPHDHLAVAPPCGECQLHRMLIPLKNPAYHRAGSSRATLTPETTWQHGLKAEG